MPVIVIANSKGGSGKSTLTVALAVAANATIIDADPQATVACWGDRRRETPQVITAPLTRVSAEVSRLGGSIIVDTPGAMVGHMLDALKGADLVLIPTTVDQFDIDAVATIVGAAQMAKRPAAIVPSRLHPRADAEAAAEMLSGYGLPVAPAIRERAIHRQAAVSGKTALDIEPNGPAAAEIRALWQWVENRLHG